MNLRRLSARDFFLTSTRLVFFPAGRSELDPYPLKTARNQETLLATNADFVRSQFADVNLREAQFTDVNLANARFTDVNLSGATFGDMNLSHVVIENCDVTGMKIQGLLVSELLRVYREKA